MGFLNFFTELRGILAFKGSYCLREGGNRGWDGWMASLTQLTWVWTNSRRWWRTGKPGVLQSVGSQRVRHDWLTEHRQTNLGRELIQRQVFISVHFSHSIVSDSLRPHGLQHIRPPCPSPTPGACSNSCPWVGDAIQPSHPLSSPSPPALDLSQHQSFFKWVSSSH